MAIEIMKNKSEKFVIEQQEYRGSKLLVCRIWFKDRNGEWHPTKRGLNLQYQHWRQLLPELTGMLDLQVEGEAG